MRFTSWSSAGRAQLWLLAVCAVGLTSFKSDGGVSTHVAAPPATSQPAPAGTAKKPVGKASHVAKAAPPEPTFDPATLSVAFKDKTLASAAADIESGRAKAARALKVLPAKSKDLRILFLRAEALAATGDEAAAAGLFEKLSARYTPMKARCHCLAAAAFEHLGDLTRAATHYAACALDPVRGRSALLSEARVLGRLGRIKEALNVLEKVSPKQQAAMLAVKAQVLMEGGLRKSALAAYRDVYFGEPLSPSAKHAFQAAQDLARRLKARPPTTLQLATRVEKLLAGHRTREAERAARDLPKKPICSGASCALRACTSASHVYHEAPVLSVAESSTSELDPAKASDVFDLAKAHDPEDSGKLVAPPLPRCAIVKPRRPADNGLCHVQFVRGLIAQKHREHEKALTLLRQVYNRCTDPDLRARALFDAQKSADRIDDPNAPQLGLLLAAQFPDSTLADDALMAAANSARDLGEPRVERASLRYLAGRYPNSDLRSEALFRLFWSYREDGHPERGLVYLDQLMKEYDRGPHHDGADADRGRYWWGRTVASNALHSERAKGIEALQELMRDRPETYYGLLARSFVASVKPKAQEAPVSVAPFKGPLRLGLLSHDVAFQEALELWRMGDHKQAHDALESVNFAALRQDGRRGDEGILIVAELLRRAGDLRFAHYVARMNLLGLIRDGRDPLGHRAALVCYPLAFRAPVVEYANREGFSPNFMQGLMREESALDPHARSPVGARGLTQLMPKTARLVARSIGLRRFRVSSLWQPDTNIDIGCVYLGRMLKHFGHPGLAAAAYNAGPNAVDRWLAGSKMTFDEFVEDIPFKETRGYVKRVLRSFAAYQYLYEKSDPAMRVSMRLKSALTEPN